jgi:hypothetical protein
LKAMTKDKFIIVITLISVLLLLFSQSVYDPSVYAKMQKVDDENLSDVTGEALMLDLNVTASAFASDMSINNAEGDYLHFGPTSIGGDLGVGNTRFYSSQLADIGSVPGQTWILLGNLEFPAGNFASGNTLGLSIGNLSYIGHYYNGTTRVRDNTLYSIGNVTISGFHYGHNVYGITPWLNCGSPPYIMYSANDDNGLEINGQFGGYINQIRLNWNDVMSSFTATGIYLYYDGQSNDIATGLPTGWSTVLNGKMLMGDVMQGFNTDGSLNAAKNRTVMAAINIGTSGNKSIIFMDLPMHGTIRIRNVNMGGFNMGPIAIDDVLFYRNMLHWDLNRFNE